MKEKILNDYIKNHQINIDNIIDDFYGYIYIVVKNAVSVHITDEDIEEIISDVFIAIWKNYEKLSKTTIMKAYLTGISKNVIKNKYRKSELNFSISDYEEHLISNVDTEKISEEIDRKKLFKEVLKALKQEEYQIFIMFYYEGKTIKNISEVLKCSESKVKNILYRVRKKIKKNLEKGGYSYGK